MKNKLLEFLEKRLENNQNKLLQILEKRLQNHQKREFKNFYMIALLKNRIYELKKVGI